MTIIMAGIIAIVITFMSKIQNGKLKAVIYSLPLPISLSLLAIGTQVESNHITGLILLAGFLWSTYFLYVKCHQSILMSDVISAVIYIIIGYATKETSRIDFWWMFFAYSILWFIFLNFYHPKQEFGTKSSTNIIIKGSTVFITSFVLLSLKSFLSGFIVTFPYSGIFAVKESKDTLYSLAAEFTKNSIAILIFFATIKISFEKLGLPISIGLGWIIYLPTLWIVQRLKQTAANTI
jgi:hypothetical protein